MNRTITTAAELDALPAGSVVLTVHDTVWRRMDDSEGGYRFESPEVKGRFAAATFERVGDLPVTVLHDPSAPAVLVVSDAAVEAALRAIIGDPSVDEHYWRQRTRETLTAALPFLGAAPSATREDVETITIPRPHVPHGPATVAWDVADADYLRRAARDLEEFYKPFGSNLRATIVALIRDAADAITPRTDR